MSSVSNVIEVRSAVSRFGVQICLGVPAGLLAVVLILHKNFHFLSQPLLTGDKPDWLDMSLSRWRLPMFSLPIY